MLLEAFREWARIKLADYPEARSLALVVDWEVGEHDFPPGVVIHRLGPSPSALLGTVCQMAKSAALLMNEVAARAAAAAASIPPTPISQSPP
jgi:hypothetical protein